MLHWPDFRTNVACYFAGCFAANGTDSVLQVTPGQNKPAICTTNPSASENITVSNPNPLDLTEDKIMTYAELIKKLHNIEAGHYLSNNEVKFQNTGKQEN